MQLPLEIINLILEHAYIIYPDMRAILMQLDRNIRNILIKHRYNTIASDHYTKLILIENYLVWCKKNQLRYDYSSLIKNIILTSVHPYEAADHFNTIAQYTSLYLDTLVIGDNPIFESMEFEPVEFQTIKSITLFQSLTSIFSPTILDSILENVTALCLDRMESSVRTKCPKLMALKLKFGAFRSHAASFAGILNEFEILNIPSFNHFNLDSFKLLSGHSHQSLQTLTMHNITSFMGIDTPEIWLYIPNFANLKTFSIIQYEGDTDFNLIFKCVQDLPLLQDFYIESNNFINVSVAMIDELFCMYLNGGVLSIIKIVMRVVCRDEFIEGLGQAMRKYSQDQANRMCFIVDHNDTPMYDCEINERNRI